MFRLGTLWGYGAEYIPLEEEVERISTVSLAEIRRCVEKFPLVPTVKIVVMPAPEAKGLDDADDETLVDSNASLEIAE
jgi:predicted Zn-dependent peptidase